jgi:SAM-dependent methyltransferase
VTIERADPSSWTWQDIGAEHLSRYFFAADWVRDKHVLDVGTGAGFGLAVLRAAGARSIQALDIDEATLALAEENYGGPETAFIAGSAESLAEVRTPVDLICSFENIEHLLHPEAFVRAAARVLEPDGVLLCSSPDRRATPPFIEGRPANPFHVCEWFQEEFVRLLSIGFESIDLRCQVRTHAFEARMAAARALDGHLVYLWGNPVLRLGRLVARLMGRRRVWQPTLGLATPAVGDFPIVSAAVANLVGGPYCHVAVCRRPRQPS